MRGPSRTGTKAMAIRIEPGRVRRAPATRRFARCAALAFAVTSAPAFALHGIESGDINRNGAACTDFFDYANGNWRAQHKIPDYMDRWSRRWESGEANKEHVRDILT